MCEEEMQKWLDGRNANTTVDEYYTTMFEIILKCAKEKNKTKVVCPYSKGYVLVSRNTRGCHEIPEYVTKYQRVSLNTRGQQELQKSKEKVSKASRSR